MQNRQPRRAGGRRRKRDSARIVRWLLLCFPHGLSLMWRPACTWPRAIKWGITCAFAAVLLGVLLYPAPSGRRSGRVEVVGIQREVEVYGPELPETLPDQKTYQYNTSYSVLVPADENEEVEYVYAAEGAYNYHRFSCKYAYASSQTLTVYEATFLGYTPCRLCRPPVYGETSQSAEETPAPETGSDAETGSASWYEADPEGEN